MIPPSEYFVFKCTTQVHPLSKARVYNPLCGQTESIISGIFKRKEKNPLLIYTPTSQVSPRLVALTCDNLCPLSQSCIKLSISPTAQSCKTDSAASQQAPRPPSLNALPPIAQLHWKQGIFYSNNCAQFLKKYLYTQE